MTALQNILFLDIETVSQFPEYRYMPEDWQQLWNKKAETILKYHEGQTTESLYQRSSIYAEFGKVICISCGIIIHSGDGKKLIIKSFYGDDEKEVLLRFSNMLQSWASAGDKLLCAHNGKEFDFPFLCRRMIINNVPIPSILNVRAKKPWEANPLVIIDMLAFGEYKSCPALNLLAHVLNVAISEDDVVGSVVADVDWKEITLEWIVTYCQ